MGAVLDKTAYEWETSVTCFEVDKYRRLRLSALMKLHQEVGELHLHEFGTDSDRMRDEQQLAFIFTKVAIKVHRMPRMEEKIRVRTWCSSLKGARFTRNYAVLTQGGELLTEAKGEVTTLNLESRRIVRPREINGFEDFLYNEKLENSCEYPEKLIFPECEAKCFSRTARFSDIDFNGHVNNTVYADIVTDCLPPEKLEAPIKSFTVNYVSEMLEGETLKISAAENGDTEYFKGEIDGRICFEAKLTI